MSGAVKGECDVSANKRFMAGEIAPLFYFRFAAPEKFYSGFAARLDSRYRDQLAINKILSTRAFFRSIEVWNLYIPIGIEAPLTIHL